MTENESDTIELPRDAFLAWAFEEVTEQENWDIHSLDGVEQQDLWRELCPENVHTIDDGSEEIHIHGRFTVREVVGRRPASGGGKFDPPTNPPETITEDAEMGFTIILAIEGLPYASGHVEVL